MNKIIQTIAAALLLLLVACQPRECAEWSPDGSRAAILAEDQIYFTDPQGNLSNPIPDRDSEPGRLLVHAFDWLSDGSGLVLHRVRIAPQWEEIAPLLPEADGKRVAELAAKMPSLLEAAVVLHGDADRAEQLLGKLMPGEFLAIANALRLALARDSAPVRRALTDAPRALASLGSESTDLDGFLLHELVVLRPDSAQPAEVLARGLRGIDSLKVSPQHSLVACAYHTENPHRFDLIVHPLSPGPAVTVSQGIARAYDWTPEGHSLVFLSSISENSGGLVEIERRRVVNDQGQISDPLPGGAGDGTLAYAVVAFSPRLAVLPNGDVLFSSHPGNLPAASGDLEENPRLYRLPADGGDPIAIPTAEGSLPMDLGFFVPSPDGRRAIVVESGTDAVALLDLESGRSELISEPHPRWKTRVMPSWRNAEEFAYAALDPTSGRVGWKFWKDGKTIDLSETWPDKTTNSFLEYK